MNKKLLYDPVKVGFYIYQSLLIHDDGGPLEPYRVYLDVDFKILVELLQANGYEVKLKTHT